MQEKAENRTQTVTEMPSIDWLNWTLLQQDADELMYYMHSGELRDGWEEWMEGFESELRAAKTEDAKLKKMIKDKQKALAVLFRDIRDLTEELAKAVGESAELAPYITGITQAVDDGLETVGFGIGLGLGEKGAEDDSTKKEEGKQ